jgi:Domain of unknown function (DUF1707)
MEPYRDSKPGPDQNRPRGGGVLRASDQDRDETVQRLQVAFAEGRLTDGEFDDRMRTALAARTHADLDELMTDLPDAAVAPRPAASVAAPKPGRQAIAYKNSIRLSGRWRVPAKFRAIVYKGSGVLDLRAAELVAPVTTIRAIAYKSNIEILVPPGIRVEVNGIGATRDEDWAGDLAPDAPVVHIHAFAYKGLVETRSRSGR